MSPAELPLGHREEPTRSGWIRWSAPIPCTRFYVSPKAAAAVSGDPWLGTRYDLGAGSLSPSELACAKAVVVVSRDKTGLTGQASSDFIAPATATIGEVG